MDEDTLELFERRLAERVEARVRGRLFAYYTAVGTVILAVIGFFGYNIVTGLESRAQGYAESAVAPSVEAANAAADEARARAAEIAARLDALEDFQSRREAALLEGERQVQRNQSRVKELADEIERRLQDIVTRLQETQVQVQATRDQLQDAQSELSAQQARVRETAGIGNFAELAANLAELSHQVALLDEQLREIRTRTAGLQGYEAPLADAGRIETIQRLATAQAQSVGVAPAEMAAAALPPGPVLMPDAASPPRRIPPRHGPHRRWRRADERRGHGPRRQRPRHHLGRCQLRRRGRQEHRLPAVRWGFTRGG